MDMPSKTRVVAPGPDHLSVRTADGQILRLPPDWLLLPPGDPALTRRAKAAGPTWTVQERKGRKLFSRGIWVCGATVEQIRADLLAERAKPEYAKKLAAGAKRREREQIAYVETFEQAVHRFLAFDPRHQELAARLARAVASHATPVGSGTVARTERIPVEQRAEAAVIAWMRHHTTGYDHMSIARMKGKRREVRRMLAEQSRRLLQDYRSGIVVDLLTCKLEKALKGKL